MSTDRGEPLRRRPWTSISSSPSAQRRIEESLRLAGEADDAVSLAHALCFGAVYSEAAGLDAQAREMAERALVVARDKGFSAWIVFAEVCLAWHDFAAGGEASQLDALRDAVARLSDIGVDVIAPLFISLLARAYGMAGDHDSALETLDRAEALAEARGERWWTAELARLRGELLLGRADGGESEAEACFERAMAVAAHQGARSLELRAATSLAARWSARKEQERAHALVAPLLGRFTEGSGTPDLRVARSFLEGLDRPPLEAASD